MEGGRRRPDAVSRGIAFEVGFELLSSRLGEGAVGDEDGSALFDDEHPPVRVGRSPVPPPRAAPAGVVAVRRGRFDPDDARGRRGYDRLDCEYHHN